MKLNRVSQQTDINKQFRQAIKKCKPDKVIELVKSGGIDLQAANKRGNTPIHLAAKLRKTSLLQYLLNIGSSPTAENHEGNTPMHLFMRAIVSKLKNKPITQEDFALLKTLIEENDIDKQNLQGDTILHILAKYTTDEKQEADKLFKFFTSYNADLSIQNKQGNAPLHLSAKRLHSWTISRLIGLGANPNQLNGKQLSPFNVALKSTTEKISNIYVTELPVVSTKRTVKVKKAKTHVVNFKSKKSPLNEERVKAIASRFHDTRDHLFFYGASADLNEKILFSAFHSQAKLKKQQKLLDIRLLEESKKSFHQNGYDNLKLNYRSNPFDNMGSKKQEIATMLYNGAPERYKEQQALYRQKMEELKQPATQLFLIGDLKGKDINEIDLGPVYLDGTFPRAEWISYMETLLACTDVEEKFASVATLKGESWLEVQSSDLLFINLLKKKMGLLPGTKLIINNSQEPNLYIFYVAGINGDHLRLLKKQFPAEHVREVLKKCRDALKQKSEGGNTTGKFVDIPVNYAEIESQHKELSQLKEKGRTLSKYSPSTASQPSNVISKAKRKRSKKRNLERINRETPSSLPLEVKKIEFQNTKKEPTYELTATPIDILQKEKISEEKAFKSAKFVLKDSSIQARFEIAQEAFKKIQQILASFDSAMGGKDLYLLSAKALEYYMMVFFESLHTTSELADRKTEEASSIASAYLIDRSIAANYRNALRHFKKSSREEKIFNLARRLRATDIETTLSSLLSGELEIGGGKPISEFEFKGYQIKEEKGEKGEAIADEVRMALSQIEIFLTNLNKSESHKRLAQAAILKAVSDISAALQNLSAQKWEKLKSDAPLLIKVQKNGNRLSHSFSRKEGESFDETAWKSIKSILKKLNEIKKQTELVK